MKTSTPTNTHSLRKHSLNKNFLAIEDNEEIEAEKQQRREEAINRSAEVRRKSIAAPLIAGLTASELTQHCKDCIKLSTENKINTKNAFSFLLIDVMAAMAKKSDSEINKNFQVASCTLDASVKIYGYRVDAVHTEAIKMAGGVASWDVGNTEENAENVEENREEEFKTKVKKKKRKKLTVVQPETLNAKLESDLLMDVIPHQSFLMHKTDGNDLLIKVPKYDDNGVFYINSEYVCWPFSDKGSVPSFKKCETFDPGSLKSMLKEISVSKTDQLCDLYHNFEFGKEVDDSGDNMSDEEHNSPEQANCFEFDLNATVEDVPMADETIADVEPLRNRVNVPVGGYESDEEIPIPSAPEQTSRLIPLSDLKNRITLQQLEYSMFDEKVLKGWAGPSYWKVCPRKDEGKENENFKAVGSKSTRKMKVKPTAGLFDIEEDVLAKYLSCKEKTILNKATMLNWSPQNVTVPRDCKYKTKNFLSLFHFPDFFINLSKEEKQVELGDISDHKSEPQEELEYCSNVSMHPDYAEEDDKKEEENNLDKEEIWDEKNMVAMPNKVEKIQVSAFKRKKNVDIKFLKKCLWNMLIDPGNKPSSSENVKVNHPITFSEIMKSYGKNMPNSLVPNLSAPQIFNALLHLTNEKCLILTQDKLDKSDFVVSQ
ncbi:UNVERIFIED_CONTAM: hypothetical protein PYX00_007439 [Menopon gallinae]|uniref:Condensin complex subunit 2 n=1 Tax=Menopon gallinae TaxID=328185 RepID=A0AAW2HJ28_9NEOP